jgi:hypothetical protein
MFAQASGMERTSSSTSDTVKVPTSGLEKKQFTSVNGRCCKSRHTIVCPCLGGYKMADIMQGRT